MVHSVTRRTLALAVLRGALLDLLATDDEPRVGAAVRRQAVLLGGGVPGWLGVEAFVGVRPIPTSRANRPVPRSRRP